MNLTSIFKAAYWVADTLPIPGLAADPYDFEFFWKPNGINGYLSQWYVAPFVIDGDDTVHRTCEHYMMAEKARLFGDEQTRAEILAERSPAAVKKLARKARGFDEDLWQQHRLRTVVDGNYFKFTGYPQLAKRLLATATRTLVEAAPTTRSGAHRRPSQRPARYPPAHLARPEPPR